MDRYAKRRMKRRMVMPGYPEHEPFSSMDEVNDYLSGSRITCLLCGKEYKRLGRHLSPIHGVTENEYRVLYSIPWRRGLTSAPTHRRYVRSGNDRVASGTLGFVPGASQHLAAKAPHRKKMPVTIKEVTDRIRKFNKENTGVEEYPREETLLRTFEEMARSDRSLREVIEDGGFPGASWYSRVFRDSPESHRLYREVVDNLSFKAQARAESLGDRFAEEVRSLRPMSDKKIARLLGVTTMTVNRFRRKVGIE